MRGKILLSLVVMAAICVFISVFSLGCGSGEETQGNETGNNTLATMGAYIGIEPIYMTMEGMTQGVIEGPCMLPGREGAMLVYKFSHDLKVPFDSKSGLPTAKRTHSPLTITKVFDKASPKLYQALNNGERFKYVTFEFYRLNANGNDEHYFTIGLEDAVIVSIKPYVLSEADGSTEILNGHMEELSFTYKKIVWTYEPEGIQTEDVWQPPKSG
ncbi:MAG TPA: Hcp family type VI secretion system effector [Dehalococcoidia bacterium]|nr:Hcp family type VI secretion system effector [Dehalococcoidia bacterium]